MPTGAAWTWMFLPEAVTLHVGEGIFATRASEGSDELLEFFTAELEEDIVEELEEATELLLCGIRVESKTAV